MVTKIDLTPDEAKEIVLKVFENESPGSNFESFDSLLQLQAITGAVAIVRAMQAIGYRITRPLKEL